MAEFGRLDVVVAQAGILPMNPQKPDPMDFVDAVDVDLIGVMNAVAVSVPHLLDGASIVITGSIAAMMEGTVQGDPGGKGYSWSKRVVSQYAEQMALHLAPRSIRVNCIHPTNVNTPLLQNEGNYRLFRPDLENPTREDAEQAFYHPQAMPIPYLEPEDVADLAVFLASDASRYITGQQIRIDAGSILKFPKGPM
jgi:NAD(P)-dependent dehydrogenase (short-subunit alcohol dehydrogenase family)